MIVSAIRGTLTGLTGSKVRCDAIFDHTDYWLDEGVIIKGNLTGRTITIDGVGDFTITDHDPEDVLGGTVTLDSVAGISGNETFRIKARSPKDTGKQQQGTLRDGNSLEPGTLIRLTPRSLAAAGTARVGQVRAGQRMVKRYSKLRWHRFRGTAIQLRYLSKNSIAAVEQYEDEKQVGEDIRLVAGELGIPVTEPVDDTSPPAE